MSSAAAEVVDDHEGREMTGVVGRNGERGVSRQIGEVGGSDGSEHGKLGGRQSSGPIHIEADSCLEQQRSERQVVGSAASAPRSASEHVTEHGGEVFGAEGAYPAIGAYEAWVNMMNVHHGMPPAEMYAMNVPGGYAGQPYLPAMMYMPVPHIAPRLAPPFIDRQKSGPSSRGTSRSPRRDAHGVHGHEGRHETWVEEARTSSSGGRDQLSEQLGHRMQGGHGAERPAGGGSPGSDDHVWFLREAGPSLPSSLAPAQAVSNQKPCAFFLQHGSCAFGSKCKFSHPIELAPVVEYNAVGLPRRYGQPTCRYYVQTGRCSYGYTCRYDHPDF